MAAAQASTDNAPNGLGQEPTTSAPAERVQAPQPQPQPQAQPLAQSAQPQPAQGPPPSNNYPNNYSQPYAPASAPTAQSGARDANNQYVPTGQDGAPAPYAGNEQPKSKFELPTMSVRVDPLNWLLAGRLGLELESQVWKFISVQIIPEFIVNDQPPYLNLGFIDVPNNLHQSGAAAGSLSGASFGVGFWLNEKPLEGYVLRAEFTDYLINYDAKDALGAIDHVKYAERNFEVLFGSHSKWGPVTLAGTFGLGSALEKQQRCFQSGLMPSPATAMTSGCPNNKQMNMVVTRDAPPVVVNLNSGIYPITIVARISIGVVF